jgi:hypothetical protein
MNRLLTIAFWLLALCGSAAAQFPNRTGAPIILGSTTELGATLELNGETISGNGIFTGNNRLSGTTSWEATDTITSHVSAGVWILTGPATFNGAVVASTTLAIDAIPSSAGSGGLYVCIDSSGNTYKKSSCP